MLKKSTSVFILFLIIGTSYLMAQTNNYEFVQHEANYSGSEEFIVLHGDIYNLIDSAFDLTITRVTHEKPDAWNTSFCVGPACLPPFLDIFTFNIAANDTAVFSLDTYPNGELGVGSWTIYAVDSLTMEVDSVQITMEVVAVGINDSFSAPDQFDLSDIFPNPTNAWINFDLTVESAGDYRVALYSLNGREITSRNYSLRNGKNLIQWGMGSLPSGNYLIAATHKGQTISKQVSVIK